MDKSGKWPENGYSEKEVEKIERLKDEIRALDEKELSMFFNILTSVAGEMIFAEVGRAERLLRYAEQAKMWINMLRQIGKTVEGNPETFVQKVLCTPSIISTLLANQGVIDLSSREFDKWLKILRKETQYDRHGYPAYSKTNYKTAAKASRESYENLLRIPELLPIPAANPNVDENLLAMPAVGGIQSFLVTRGKKSSPTVRERELARVLDKSEIAFHQRLRTIQVISMADVYGSAVRLKSHSDFFHGELEEAERVIEIMNRAIERGGKDSPVVQALKERFDANKRYRAFLEVRMDLETTLAIGKSRMDMVNDPMNMMFFKEIPEGKIRELLQQHLEEKHRIEGRRGQIISIVSPKERMLAMAFRKKRQKTDGQLQ